MSLRRIPWNSVQCQAKRRRCLASPNTAPPSQKKSAIWSSDSNVAETEWSLLWCDAVSLSKCLSTFQSNRVSSSGSSGPRQKATQDDRVLLCTFFFFKYCLLANRLEDTSVYNLICCLVVVSWKGDHPAMSPQSCRSEVQRLFSLLLRVSCVSVSTSGLGWHSNLLRCLVILSMMTSRKWY